jgi:hypothetical protein
VRKHSLDLTSLLAGLVFIGLAAVYLLAAATGNEVDSTWVLPIALVALGLAGLVGGITRAVRRDDDPAAERTETATVAEVGSSSKDDPTEADETSPSSS